jgi:hypothetical protein
VTPGAIPPRTENPMYDLIGDLVKTAGVGIVLAPAIYVALVALGWVTP